MNTRFLEYDYEYIKPSSLDEALQYIASHKNVKFFAGGTDLIVKMKVGAVTEIDTMLDLNGIEELQKIYTDAEGRLVIGAAAKLSAIEKNADIKADYPLLCCAISRMASVSIRNMGTIGGNFCNASPVADTAGPAICYHGLVELKSVNGTRTVPAEDFFLKPGVSVIAENEIMTALILPAPAANCGTDFIKFGRVSSDIAKLSISVMIVPNGETIQECRIAMGSIAAKPVYLKEISENLNGKEMSDALAEETAHTIADFIKPITDSRSTAEYRKEATKVIATDALKNAWNRCGGK